MKHLLLLSLFVIGCAHSGYNSHKHDEASLSLTFDKTQGQVELTAPEEAVSKDKAKNLASVVEFDSALGCKVSKTNVGMMAKKHDCAKCDHKEKMDCDKCDHKAAKMDCKMCKEGKKGECSECADKKGHGDIAGKYSVNCKKDLKGSALKVVAIKNYPALKKVAVAIVADDVKKDETVKSESESIEVK